MDRVWKPFFNSSRQLYVKFNREESVKKLKLPVASALIASLVFPVWAAEEIKVTPPNMREQTPVAEQRTSNVNEPVASNKSRLTFMDSKLFDVKLSKELESGKDVVEVDVSGRVPLSNIPGRIDRWVVKSAEEGKVELLPSEQAPKTRFIFSLIPMVFNAFGFMKNVQEENMYDQAKHYDTKIYYKKDDAGDTLIEKIVMTRRK